MNQTLIKKMIKNQEVNSGRYQDFDQIKTNHSGPEIYKGLSTHLSIHLNPESKEKLSKIWTKRLKLVVD